MTNTSAPFMTSIDQQTIVDKQKAELYMQLYPYASEDFLSSMDATTYSNVLATHIENLQSQLTSLFKIVANHTHVVPPHVHGVINHSVTTPVSQITEIPIQSPSIAWSFTKTPLVQNTTGSAWNLAGNFQIEGLPSEGMLITSKRRALPLPKTLTITLPPIYTAGI